LTVFTTATAEEPFQSQAVDGIAVRFQVLPLGLHGPVGGHGPSGIHREFPHRITVTLTEQATGRAVTDAEVAIEVAKSGRTGERVPLTAEMVDGHHPVYVTEIPLAGRGTTYRIRVQFVRPGSEPREAEFRYAHH
jgi:hypothetical protein